MERSLKVQDRPFQQKRSVSYQCPHTWMHVHIHKGASVYCFLQGIWFCRGLGKCISKAHVAAHMRKVLNGSRQGLLSEHLDHVDSFSLLRQMSASGCRHQVVRICADVDRDLCTTDVSPEASQHLTGAKALHESIQLGNSRRQGCSCDLVRLKLHQGSS